MKKESNSIKELCEFIWDLEEKYNLFDFKVDDVFIWEYIRMQVYYKLAISLGVLTPQTKKTSNLERVKIFLKSFKNIFTHNFWTLKQYDTIFFSHPRSVKVNESYIDIYTEYIINELKQDQQVIDFEADYQGAHLRKRKHGVHVLDWIKQLVYVNYFFKIKKKILNEEEKAFVKSIEKEIYEHYEINFNLLIFLEKKVKLFKLYYDIYNNIFKKVAPSSIYIVVAYYFAPIIKAAKDRNIEVNELQHGIITQYHLGYSFPYLRKPLHYFPDKLLVWDKGWKDMVNYPIPHHAVIVDKFRYLEDKKGEYKDIKKKENHYLIISQTAISENIAKKILDNIEFFKGKTIVYKLHPGEFEIYKNNKYLTKLKEILNVEIVSNERNLYELMAASEFQVGVFSTALYEGVAFDCKTVLLGVNGIEYMEDFIEVNDTIVLN